MKPIVLLFGLLLLTSCGTTVAVDYDKQAEFSQYTTYNYYPTISSGLSELDEQRVRTITDSLLREKGFVKADTPQLYINFFTKEQLAVNNNTIGFGIGGGGGNVGIGVGGGIPIGGKKVEQRLTFDFIDVVKDDLVFQVTADGTYKERANPVQKDTYYARVISKMLAKYPPKQ
ncbi:MAG: hypothetical protein CMC08_02765 [Flavobacteriaceae bacterium]|nr:hypothetical protein [Flavobacteriaceae bacterium]